MDRVDGAPVVSAAAKPMALATVPREVSPAIEPTNMGELVQLATSAGKTGFFGAKTPEQALLVMMSGRDLGLSYAQSLRAFHVIEGKPSLSADGMVAVALVRRDVCEFFRTIEVTNDHATVETKRMGQEAQRYTFTMADAQRAGVGGKPNWQRYPSRMLLARARSALARDVYPDLLMGLYDPDEVESAARVIDAEVVSPGAAAMVQIASRSGAGNAPPSEPKAPGIDVDKLTADFKAQIEKCGREGTLEELNAIVASITKVTVGRENRKLLVEAHREAQASIKAREAAKADAEQAFSGFEKTREREPGEEG